MAKILKLTVDGERAEIDVEKLTFAEARAIEKVTGADIAEALKKMSMTTVQALIWVTWKRHHPGSLFSDFDDKAISDVDMEWEKEAEPEAPASPTLPAAEG